MRPQANRLAVRRASGARTLPWGLIIPGGEDHGTAHVGRVIAAGPGARVRDRVLPLEIGVGDRIIYSSRTDSFRMSDGSTVDLVEENSVLGIVQ